MVWNWLRRHPWLVDGALVVVFTAFYVGSAAHQGRGAPGILLAVATVVPLYWRRRFPIAVLAVVTAASAAASIAYSDDVPLAPALAIYSVAAHVERRRSLRACAVAVAVLMVAFGTVSLGHTLPNALFFIAVWVGGD